MPKPVGGGRYMAGLDGLRALAVIAVIAYHLKLGVAPGGLLGVGVFFVLSGYLITDILAAQWRGTGRLDLKQFWLRRARRLLPAMLATVAAVALWSALSGRPNPALQEDLLAAVLYVSNWYYIFRDVSYFESFGPPSPLGHLWSLAVEEQFYLLWPLLLAAGLRIAPRRGALAALIALGAAMSAVAMALLYVPGTDPSRVYYGTDTRAFGLLIGASLAVGWPSRKLTQTITAAGRWTLDAIGAAGLGVIGFMIVHTSQYDPALYRGGLVWLSLAAAAVVAALAHPATLLSEALGWKPLRWIGVRSYGIYMWHYPVIVLSSPVVDTGSGHPLRTVLQVAVTIALAELSWRYIEEPVRRGALGQLWSRMKRSTGRTRRSGGGVWTGAVVVLFLVTVVGIGAVQMYPSVTASFAAGQTDSASGGPDAVPAVAQPDRSLNGVVGSVSRGEDCGVSGAVYGGSCSGPVTAQGAGSCADLAVTGKPDPQAGVCGDTSGKGAGSSVAKGPESCAEAGQSVVRDGKAGPCEGSADGGNGSAVATGPESCAEGESSRPGAESPACAAKTAVNAGSGVTAIGDSVIIDAAPYLQKLLPGIVVDGKIGRQMSEAPDVVQKLKAEGNLGSRVIIELGTNGAFTKKQLESLLASLEGVQQIVLVNTRVPRPWESDVNATLSEAAASFPHTTLVNWYESSSDHNGYFYDDGVHLVPDGAEAYAALVAKAVKPLATGSAIMKPASA